MRSVIARILPLVNYDEENPLSPEEAVMRKRQGNETRWHVGGGARLCAVFVGMALLGGINTASSGEIHATAKVSPWAAYRYAPDALKEIDLASDTDWMLDIGIGAPRPIKVTGGGWN